MFTQKAEVPKTIWSTTLQLGKDSNAPRYCKQTYEQTTFSAFCPGTAAKFLKLIAGVHDDGAGREIWWAISFIHVAFF